MLRWMVVGAKDLINASMNFIGETSVARFVQVNSLSIPSPLLELELEAIVIVEDA